MADIAKDDAAARLSAASAAAVWHDPQAGIVACIAAAAAVHGAHLAHVVVLVPFAQLMPLARSAWAAARPDGFSPRIETTMNWAASRGGPQPGGRDLRFETARDLLAAQSLLDEAGLGAQRHLLAPRLVELAHGLGRQVAATAPPLRAAWAGAARDAVGSGPAGPAFAYEAALAHIALEWALASSYASDGLFDAAPADEFLVVLEGLQTEPLTDALRRQRGARGVALPLVALPPVPGAVAWHAAMDADDEGERAAACVLRHLAAGRAPVALAATDRALTRSIRAMLGARGVAVQDESGWKLSTTRAAAGVVALLRAAAWNASADAVLDALKLSPAFLPGDVAALEAALRRDGVATWQGWQSLQRLTRDDAAALAAARISADFSTLRGALQKNRPFADWLAALRALLQAAGQWPALQTDAAGLQLMDALGLDEAVAGEWAAALADTAAARHRMPLADFTAWVGAALEAASFVPAPPSQPPDVVILPLSQLLARPFAAVVLPGCDELRLPAAPEPPGPWTGAQRAALGLPDRATLQAAAESAWRHAIAAPYVDVLWRTGDGRGEALLASPLVQASRAAGIGRDADDPRDARRIDAAPTVPSLPRGDALPVRRLSASAYEDVRRCPYRFFALRQLGLKEADELDDTLDKRDFGLWLHEVLRRFHEALLERNVPLLPAGAAQLAIISEAAEGATASLALSPAEFLPFAAAWPAVRDGYLAWLGQHTADGAHFADAERWVERALASFGAHPLTLIGQIDRIDHAQGGALLIDYKTESLDTSKKRVKEPTEDTQLAFYAALMDADAQAAYVNVGERGVTTTVQQPEVLAARDAVLHGIHHDLGRIAGGTPLPALGDGAVCDHCAARGLCRKDFWAGGPAQGQAAFADSQIPQRESA